MTDDGRKSAARKLGPSAPRARTVLARAAAHATAYQYRIWGFGEGPALLGLVEASDLLGREDLLDFVQDLIEPTLGRPPEMTDHLIPVEVLVALQRRRPSLAVDDAIRRFTAAVLHAPRPVADQPQVHRPDDPRLATKVWVDCMHTDGPGLAFAGYTSEAVRLLDEISGRLQGESGLFSHGYDVAVGRTNGVHWGRGQGWALHGLVGLAVLAPDAARLDLHNRIQLLLAALAEREIDGSWRTIVDDSDSPIENSLSPMVAATVMTGIAHGVVDCCWETMAQRALKKTLGVLEGGALPVSSATPVGGPDIYRSRPNGVFPWGQGPVLLALSTALGAGDP